MFIRKTIIALAIAAPVVSAFAMNGSAIDKSIPLKDGSTLHLFKNGKMAMEDKYGRATRMNIGDSMLAADGTTFTMNSDEVAMLSSIMRGHNGHTK